MVLPDSRRVSRAPRYLGYRFESVEGSLRCQLKLRESSAHRTLSDLTFTDSRGVKLAELVGVEMHVVPSARAVAAP